jgi:hypothetical protein
MIKCLEAIRYMFQVKDLGKKLRKFIASCDVCQRVEHSKRSTTIEEKHHFPTRPGDVGAVDIQNVPGEKVDILGGHSISHSKQKCLYEHVSYPERVPT